MRSDFLPILLGSDLNVYGMARSFHEEFGLKSVAIGAAELAPTRHSKIVSVETHPELHRTDKFLSILESVAAKYNPAGKIKLLLIACGDGYVELVSHHKEALEKLFIVPYIDEKMVQQLINKESFYETCEQYGLDYPSTVIITPEDHAQGTIPEKPFGFPVALKPADSVEYLKYDFPGKKKAFVLHDQAELDQTIDAVFASGYRARLILQDFIPGDDSRMRVLNAYVDQDHRVRMLCLGHPLLEDHAPASVGNYLAIVQERNDDVYQKFEKFLQDIEFTGFANFDMKYDERDGTYKLFEINLRQGRSSFFVTLSGYNLARYLVADRIDNNQQDIVYADNPYLWLGVPARILKKFATDGSIKQQALRLISQKKFGSTLFYRADFSLRRYLLLYYIQYRYLVDFKKHFRKHS